MIKGYQYHWRKNREEWTKKFFNKHHPQHDFCKVRNELYLEEEWASIDDDYRWSLDSLEECEQVRVIWTSEHGHCLKIKWEHAAWWEGDLLHHYYCVMLPIDDVNLLEPYDLANKPRSL